MTKVLLINPPGDVLYDEHLEPPLGLLSIASYLQERAGLRAEILDLTSHDLATAQRLLEERPADIFGLTVYCTKSNIVRTLTAAIRRAHGDGPLVVLGGPNPTALPSETLAEPGVDCVVVGEGEKALAKLVDARRASNGAPFTRAVVHGERFGTDEFPLLDFTFVDGPDRYARRCFGLPVVTLEASRGCRNICMFCNSVVMGGGSNRLVIVKNPDTVVRELQQCLERGLRVFRFNDDSFVYAAKRSGLLDRLPALGIRYRIFANARDLDPDTAQKLRDSGCFHIGVGVESYNPENLRLIGKSTTQEELRAGINAASAAGIAVRAYFLVGLPFDTDDNVLRYMEQAADDLAFEEYAVYPLIPYPGTAIWRTPERFGYSILDRDVSGYVQIGKGSRAACVLRHRSFDEQHVRRWLELVDELFAARGRVQTLHSKVL